MKSPYQSQFPPCPEMQSPRRRIKYNGAIRFFLLSSFLFSVFVPWSYFYVRSHTTHRQPLSNSTSPPPILIPTEYATTQKRRPLLIFVTPTHVRAAQSLHITNIVNVLRVAPPPIVWIVIESIRKTSETHLLLERTAGRCLHIGESPACSKVNYVHLSTPFHREDSKKSRGVNQRNTALEYIEKLRLDGIVYFMDDDNTYDPQLFEELRTIKRVGIFPVGFLWSKEYQQVQNWQYFGPFVERPLVKKGFMGHKDFVIGWETFSWAAAASPDKARKFNIDMAGFAFRSVMMWEPTNVTTRRPRHPIRFQSVMMFLETLFLDRLIYSLKELEPLADKCQQVLVWHVKMESRPTDPYPLNWWVPQPHPAMLEPDALLNKKARFLVNGTRHILKGFNGTMGLSYGIPQNISKIKS